MDSIILDQFLWVTDLYWGVLIYGGILASIASI